MPFRNRSRSSLRLRPVNRIKHVVDIQAALSAGGNRIEVLADATDTPTLGVNNSVETACTINGIYLKVEATRTGTTSDVLANFYLTVGKNPGNNLTLPLPNVVGINDNKKYVIHQEMVMLQGTNAGNPRTVFNGVVVLPRGYRRFGPDDRLELHLLTPGVNVNYCVQCHYKEFR